MYNTAQVKVSDIHPTVASHARPITQSVEDLSQGINAQFESDSEVDSSPEAESVPSAASEWNGDPMEWESWPSGRPGPYTTKPDMRISMDVFRVFEKGRNKWSREKEKVFHIAEFSTTCEEMFMGHVTELKLDDWLRNRKPESSYQLLFASSRQNDRAILSTYAQRVFSACGAPAAIWSTLQPSTSTFYSFVELQNSLRIFHGWMTVRIPLNIVEETLKTQYPRLYFSFHAGTRKTTVLTTDINEMHLRMVDCLKNHAEKLIRPEMLTFRLLIAWFAAIIECFNRTARYWEDDHIGPKKALGDVAAEIDLKTRVESTEGIARAMDQTKCDALALKAAITESARQCQMLAHSLYLDPAFVNSLSDAFLDLERQCTDVGRILDNLASRYDRFLNLLLNYTNIRMVEETKVFSQENAKITSKMAELSEKNTEMAVEMRTLAKENAEVTEEMRQLARQNAEMTSNMAELMKQNAEATSHMKISTQQNAEATSRMRELAESNNRQTAQSARQTRSMASLAYDSKRDSEIVKTITVVTMIFLPATFLATVFSMGFFKFDFDETNGKLEIAAQGWIFLACSIPLTFLVLGISFAWMWWTGRKVERPDDLSAKEAIAFAADTFRLGSGPRMQSA